jgi:hypothetical protein
MSHTISAYDAQAGALAESYKSLSAEAIHAPLLEFTPRDRDLLALDIGAGSSPDAAGMAQRRRPDPRSRWPDARLPERSSVHRTGLAFHLILLGAVWMHVPPPAQACAFGKLAAPLKPGGIIVMSLREGSSEPDRPMWAAPPDEVEELARTRGLDVVRSVTKADKPGRGDVRWTSMSLRLTKPRHRPRPENRQAAVADE